MDLLNELRPAALRALTGLPKSSGFHASDFLDDTVFAANLQTKVLETRFGLKPPTARAVAELAFGRPT